MVEIVEHPVLFEGHNQPESLSEVIGMGIGAGSMCWEDMSGTGVFKSERARDITHEIINWIEENYSPKHKFEPWISKPVTPLMTVSNWNDGGDY